MSFSTSQQCSRPAGGCPAVLAGIAFLLLGAMLWFPQPALALEPAWPQGAIRAALGRYSPLLTPAGDLQLEAAGPQSLTVGLEQGGVCILDRPQDTLRTRCFEGGRAGQQRDRLVREQLEQVVSRIEDDQSRDRLHTLDPGEALRLLLGPGCPMELCDGASPDPRAMERYARAEEGLESFGDILLSADGSSLVMGLGKGQAVIFRQGSSPALMRSDGLAEQSLQGTPYRLLSGAAKLEPAWQASMLPLLSRLETRIPACRGDLLACMGGDAGQGGGLESAPALRSSPLPPRRLLRGSSQARVVSASLPSASGARAVLQLGPLLRFGEHELGPSLHASFGERLLAGVDYAHLRSAPMGAGAGLRLDCFLQALPGARLSWGLDLQAGVDGIHRNAILGQTRSLSVMGTFGLRGTLFALTTLVGFELGTQVGPARTPGTWLPYAGFSTGLEFSVLFLGGSSR